MREYLIFFMGASLGSFLGLVIDRFPTQSIVFPGSHCSHCQHKLGMYDLIPVLSQVVLRSRCRYCQARIPKWYALLEAYAGLLFVLAAHHRIDWSLTILLLLGFVLAAYDLKSHAFPVMVWLAGTFALLLVEKITLPFLFFLCLAYLAERFPLKIGSGDFLFLANLGILLPLTLLLWIIQIASLTGLLVLFLRKKSSPLAFVPFLYGSFLVLLLLGMI